MHKFTLFTILFSVMVIAVVADLVFNDYLKKDFSPEMVPKEELEVALTPDESEDSKPSENLEEREESKTSETKSDDFSDDPDFSDEIDSTALITLDFLESLELAEPRLDTESYDGLIYGFWDTDKAFEDFAVFRHKIFDGAVYLGTIYEVQSLSEIESLTVYQTLLELGQTSDSGEVNANDAYEEASFYFNHETKTNTVFLTVRTTTSVYSFEYSPTYHAKMKQLIALL